MKNFDLVWLRDRLGMTQQQLGDLAGVSRKTIVRWENGEVAMPDRKWKALLAATNTAQKDIPKRREYDAKGYPVGFDLARFQEMEDGDDAEEAALLELEGDEYEARARERFRLLVMRISPALVDEEMARYDAKTARVNGADLV